MSTELLGRVEVERLKSILFGDEQRALAEISEAVRAHHERVGTDENLRSTVSQVIVSCLRDAQVNQHEALAAAITPLIIGSVRREIVNSRDDLIDAIHPVVGRLVSVYVTGAIRDFFYGTDKRLESIISPARWALRIRSALTGIPMHVLLMRQKKLMKVEQILLLRTSGALVDCWHAQPPTTEDEKRTTDVLVANLLSAITSFAREAFADGKGELRALDTGSARLYLRGSPNYLIAVKCTGLTSRYAEKKIDAAVQEIFERFEDTLGAGVERAMPIKRVLPALADKLMQRLAPEIMDDGVRIRPPIYATAFFLLLGLTGFAGLSHYAVTQVRASAKQQDIEQLIRSSEAFHGMPVGVTRTSAGGLVVSGVAPSKEAATQLASAIQQTAGTVPVAVNLVTGLVSSTSTLVGDTLRNTTAVVDATVRTTTELVGATLNTTGNIVNAAGTTVGTTLQDVSRITTSTTGALGETTAGVGKTLNDVQQVAQRLLDLESKLGVGSSSLPKTGTVAGVPSENVQAIEMKVAEAVNRRLVGELAARVQAAGGDVRAATAGLGNGLTAATDRLNADLAALADEIGNFSKKLDRQPVAGKIVGQQDIAALAAKVSTLERQATLIPVQNQVAALSDTVRTVADRLKIPMKSRTAPSQKADADNPLQGIRDSLSQPISIDGDGYDSEAAVRDLASRVKGNAIPSRVKFNGVPADQLVAGDPARGAVSTVNGVTQQTLGTAGQIVQGTVGTTQTIATGTIGATQNIVGGVANTAGTLVQGATAATGNLVNGLTGGAKK